MNKNKNKRIKLKKETTSQLVLQLQNYLEANFELEVGNLQTEMLLDFMIDEIGPEVYNIGMSDAQKYVNERAEDMYGLFL